jgi:alkylation response protein AidB-like acyl-CoA dehydrogenase
MATSSGLYPHALLHAPVTAVLAGTVLKLGTEKHHQGLLRGIDNMTDIGCFALTELGFGKPCF